MPRASLRPYVAGPLALLAATAGLCGPAAADDQETCRKADGQTSIAACTDAIGSGKFQGRDLAALYLNRGLTWSRLNDQDRAIQDYSEAIKTDPKYALAWNNRCAVYVQKTPPDLAIQDCDEGIRLNPNYVSAYIIRASAYLSKKDNPQALADSQRAIELDKT